MTSRSIPLPRPLVLLDVETLHPVPLDMPGRRWPPRPIPARGRSAGRLPLRPSPSAPRPSPTGVGGPKTRTLHRIVREHLETYLAEAEEGNPMGDGVPAHVENEFRS
jgi:hypothetical protein